MANGWGGKRVSAGAQRKSVEEHQTAGTYRADRHAPLVKLSEICWRPKPQTKAKCGRPGKWVRGVADGHAIKNGCWFDEARAAYVVEWFEKRLCFSDSEWAGKPFVPLEWQCKEILYPLFGWMRRDERGRVVRRFNRTYIEIPKKNGKSTLASGIGLYMLVGEGNKGNEVYSAATKIEQASIVHGTAIDMVSASEKLSAFLKINRSTRHIYNLAHRLKYFALASKPDGNEGWKGNCVVIDELHAWYGDELWNALRYMGINWPERLIFVITTAGDDTGSICFQQFELAKAIANGEMVNDRMLVCIHEAAHDDDIEDEAVQRKANPSLGHTILMDDLKADIAEAKGSLRLGTALKRYRFNIWQTATDPWINMDEWGKCKRDYTEEELMMHPCWAGLDLARKSDMTSLVLVFRRDDEYLQLPFFWLPEATAERWRGKANYHDWAARGFLTLTPGDVADYGEIENEILEIIERFDPRSLAFDPYYAEEITQRIELKTAVDRVEFKQTIVNFAGPTAMYERLIGEQKLLHNGNPCLTWQAGHVEVREDNNKNIRPVKEKRGSHKAIDGIIASVMALAGIGEEQSVYETRGIITL